MKRDETVYLRHILDAINRIEEYLIQDGVIRQLEIIGEAVKHLSNKLRNRYPYIPWQDIAGARDKLIHQYFGVDIEEIWLMVSEDIPTLKAEIGKILIIKPDNTYIQLLQRVQTYLE